MKKIIILASSLVFTNPLFAEIVNVTEIPTTWILENYIGGDVVVAWRASSSCGKVSMPNNATLAQKNRFWSVVMAGKIGAKLVFVFYDNTTVQCDIVSFGLSPE